MKRLLLASAMLVAAFVTQDSAQDSLAARAAGTTGGPITIAVFGDWPYNQNLLDHAPQLVNSINSDPAVSLVLHVGDIHSGSAPCTSADILPSIPASNPGWNQKIHYWFQQFKMPMVYTPGDNEWTDCHKTKEFASGDPLKELASVRSLFFAKPGKTLGQEISVQTQAKAFDPAFPTDAKFVENVMWVRSDVVFATVNMPGSNNDTLPWTNGFTNTAAQAQEVSERTAAGMRWLRRTFGHARNSNAKAVVIALQADMWDPAALVTGGDGLDQYTPFVQLLAKLSQQFGKPVLLLNGDSHLYEADDPLATPGSIHNTPAVANFTRITVQGSTNAPAEWLRLTIDPNAPRPFTFTNVPYCANPTGAC
jgi:calcineurin-like phosphoesterase family protein